VSREMALYVFSSDGSEFSEGLVEGLDLLGIETVGINDPTELETISVEGLTAVVLVNPTLPVARDVRAAMNKAGGWLSRLPLIAAIGSINRLEDMDMLKVVDDFLVSPGGAGELVSRVKVVAVRRGGEGKVIDFGELIINLDAHQALLNGKPVDMTYKEFELLRTLASSPGRAFSREELLRSIWGYDYFGGTRTVDVHIRRLRAKIEGSRRYIETVHSVGYRFTSY
jgi:DNA-binding response OmpR family regulator